MHSSFTSLLNDMPHLPKLSGLLLTLLLSLLLVACSATSHPSQRANLGRAVSLAEMESRLAEPGPVQLETVNSADWSVPLSGLLNLDHPAARAAGLRDRDEPIQVYLHALRHPQQGLFWVDSGVAAALLRDPGAHGVGWLLRQGMPLDKMVMRESSGAVLRRLGGPLQGVLLTHMHLDHISGLPELPREVPLYTGPHEDSSTHWMHMATHGATDALLAGRPPLQVLPFEKTAPDTLPVLDLFGDASVYALQVPGHTAGSVAYLVRSTTGPVLLVGDTSHTRWGWDHGVEPGSYTRDSAANARSLGLLRALAQRHPQIQVRLGHQP